MLSRLRLPRPDAGSALMLMPAAVLVMLLLAALALDVAAVWMGQRELANAAAAAANDVAAVALDETSFYGAGDVRLDRRRAAVIVDEHLRLAEDEPLHQVAVDQIQIDGARVEVRLHARVRPIIGFGPDRSSRVVRATAVATAQG